MSDKFFDKDDNFILWKDEGDLTKASKYVGGRRADLKTNESLTKKIAKGDIEIGREYGWMNKPLTVNWGKCGGNTDVIVTYNSGDALWIPNAFLAQGFDNLYKTPNPDALFLSDGVTKDTSVGYKTWFGTQDHSGTERHEAGNGSDQSNYYICVYKLPYNIGEYLYNVAETNFTESYGDTDTYATSMYLWKGIAIYPDTSSSWSKSNGWGVGIRKKSEIKYIGRTSRSDTSPTSVTSVGDYANLENFEQWKALEDDAYYLVSQGSTNNSNVGAMSIYLNYFGDNRIYFRHWANMITAPSATNVGEKYTYKEYGIIEKALEVNWGKCGGNSDVIVTYNEGDPLWIPKAFFTTGSSYKTASGITIGQYTTRIRIYTLPREIGAYLYKIAESNTTNIIDYDTDTSSLATAHNYKGIAIYSDTPSEWTTTAEWGVGIRKKSDIDVVGHVSGVESRVSFTLPSGLSDDDYYMVLENRDGTGANTILTRCSATTVDNGTPNSDHIYLRKYRGMTSAPSANNMGEKYTCPSELCSDNFTLTETKDFITVNWGKCGGNEDVIVNYNVGEGVWIPKEYLLTGFKSGGAPKDYTLDIKDEIGWVARFDAYSTEYPVNIYKLPHDFGKWLYENAESKDSDYYGATVSRTQHCIYRGMGFYPDTVSNWEMSYNWGIGIRRADDIKYFAYINGQPYRLYDDATLTSKIAEVDPDGYYLVAGVSNTSPYNQVFVLYGQLQLFGDEKIYLRHFKDMTAPPHYKTYNENKKDADNDDPTNLGEKYSISSNDTEILTVNHTLPTPNEDQVEIDWGAGIKTYYKYGEPMYIPRAFLMEAFDGVDSSNKAIHRPDNVGNHVGYQCWIPNNIAIYRLPNEMGEYLYNSAESWAVGENLAYNCTNSSDSGHMADGRLYKGIAIYPDTFSGVSDSFTFGIGIRKKSDLLVWKLDSTGASVNTNSVYDTTLLDDNAYYLVAQTNNSDSTSSSKLLYGQLASCFPKDEPIWLRRWKGMTAYPNGTTVMGKKMVYHPEYYALPLGGKIFYIDPEDNGATYTLFDASGNIVSGSTVDDYANAVSYLVEGTPSKDKFYVYYPTRFDSLMWWDGYIMRVLEVTNTAIGTGKTSTAIVMARTDIPTGSIWSKLSEIRTSSGFDDWFVPSKDEIDKFREADLEAWARKVGGSYLWSSTENGSWYYYWNFYSQNWSTSINGSSYSVFFTRSF